MQIRENREVEGVGVQLTNLDKVLYPATGTTKAEVIDYFQAIAPFALPHLRDRPLTRKRWPNGVDKTAFFEKRLPGHAPAWIRRGAQHHSDGESLYPVIESTAAMVWLGQQAALELHVPQWRFRPDGTVGPADRIVLDLDPGPGVTLDTCATLALRIRELLAAMGMDGYPVTSGSKGLHVYAALPAGVSSSGARTLARAIATQLESETPDLVTATMAKDQRGGRIFVDWSQNSASKTTVAPYSLRGRDHPWAAAPRSWDELTRPGLRHLTFDEVLARALADGDLLAGLEGGAPSTRPTVAVPTSPPPEPVDLGEYRAKRGWHRKPDDPTAPAAPVGGAPDPMLPTESPIDRLAGDEWAFEGKWDGYRIIATVRGGTVSLRTRSGRVVTDEFPEFTALAVDLAGIDVVLDGEAVVLNEDGVPSFHLMAGGGPRPGAVQLFLFDVLEMNGVDLTSRPWSVRRQVLENLAPLLESDAAASVPGMVDASTGAVAVAVSAELGWEGIVAKRRDAPYLPGQRARSWLKHKNWRDLQVVIGGWKPGKGSRGNGIGSVLVGLPAETGLLYLGAVGSGFTDRDLAALQEELEPLRMRRSPFTEPIDDPEARDAVWVLPKVVGDVRYSSLRRGGHLRHPSWRGFRRDLLPGDVTSADDAPWEGPGD